MYIHCDESTKESRRLFHELRAGINKIERPIIEARKIRDFKAAHGGLSLEEFHEGEGVCACCEQWVSEKSLQYISDMYKEFGGLVCSYCSIINFD